jgi:HlyD family secretion protein
MSRTRLLLTVVASLGLASLVLWRTVGGVAATPTQAATPAADAGGPSASVIAGPGRVEPVSEEIEVAPEISGKLAEVLVDEGDVVAAGQVLARLEADDYHARETAAEARLAVAEAERLRLTNGARPAERREAEAVATQAAAALDHARIEVERQRRLYEGGVIPRETLDRVERDWQVATARRTETAERLATVDADARLDELARADAAVALARASLAEARALVRKTVVRAPIDGWCCGVIARRVKACRSRDPPPPS